MDQHNQGSSGSDYNSENNCCNLKVWIGKFEEENFTDDMAGLKTSEVKSPKEILGIETNEENTLKKMAKQHYDKMRYAKKSEQEREQERLGYQNKYNGNTQGKKARISQQILHRK